MAVNCVTYSRTVFLNNDLGPLQVYTADLQVHEALRPGIVKGTTNGVNMEKEFAQFIFSLLFEFLDTCLVSRYSRGHLWALFGSCVIITNLLPAVNTLC